jgi:hypothetical protein
MEAEPEKKRQQETEAKNETPLEAFSSMHRLHWEDPPVGLLIFATPSHTRLDIVAVGQRLTVRCVGKAAHGDNMLLQQLNNKNELRKLAKQA